MVRMLKRLVALAVVVCTVALFALCSKAETPVISVTATFDKASYAQGETAVLTLNLSGVSAVPVSAFDFSLGFKSKVLKVQSSNKTVTTFTPGESVPFGNYLSVTAPKDNKIRVLYLDESADQSAPIKIDGAFCTISFTVQKNATLGTHTMMLDNDGSFSDTTMNPCKVKMLDAKYQVQKNIANCTFAKIKNRYFTGKKIKPKLSITDGDTTLVSKQDYTVAYTNNINVGKATATITGIGDYSGSKKVTFKIIQKDITDCTVAPIPSQFWINKKIKPQVSVLIGTKELSKGVDYKVKFKNNKKIGTATATFTGVGNLKGTYVCNFKILPNKVTVKSAVSQSAGTVNIKWKKSRGAQGYEIQYNFTGKWKKSKKVNLGKKQTFSLSNRKTGKKLYFRLRSYRKANKKYYYSPYSSKKYVVIS